MSHGLGRAEFADIGAAGKPRSRADQNDGRNLRIGIRALHARHQCLAQFDAKTIDGRIVEREDGDAVLDLETQFVHAHLIPLRRTEFRPQPVNVAACQVL